MTFTYIGRVEYESAECQAGALHLKSSRLSKHGLNGSPELEEMGTWTPSSKPLKNNQQEATNQQRLCNLLSPESQDLSLSPRRSQRNKLVLPKKIAQTLAAQATAKEVGDKGNELVLDYLKSPEGTKEFDVFGQLYWTAKHAHGSNCGYDIEYRNR